MYDKKTEDQLRQGRDASGCENIRWLMCICNQALAALWGVTSLFQTKAMDVKKQFLQ